MPPKKTEVVRLGLIPKEEEESEDDELFFGNDDSSEAGDVPTQDGDGDSKTSTLRGRTLKKPRSTNYSARQLFEMLEFGTIDLDPVWQRGVVWPEAKQSAVIDSIINHYYVPPVLFSQRTREDGTSVFICIDGKQRLSSISNFMNNIIPLREAGSKRKIWFSEDRNAGKTLALPKNKRRAFEMEQIAVIEYEDLLESEERDMFGRVQMGVTLSAPEKLAAQQGPWGDFWREMVKRFIDEPAANLQHIAKLDRGKDWQLMSQVSLLILEYATERVVTTQYIGIFLKDHVNMPPDMSHREEVIRVMSKFVRLANDEEHNAPVLPVARKGFPKKFLAPIEFLYVALLIWRFPQATLAQLSELVAAMTTYIRSRVKDVMMNNGVHKILRQWLNEQHVPGSETHGPASTRKRRVPMDDDDEDYRPTAVARRAPAPPAAAFAAPPAPAPAALQQQQGAHFMPPPQMAAPQQQYGYMYQQ